MTVTRIAASLLIVLAASCTPTLSQPRGEAHLDAMARARRHHHHGRMLEAARAYGDAAQHAERRVDRDEARYRQAKALERARRGPRAVEILDLVAAGRPVSRRTVRALFDASVLRLELGRRAEGIEGLRALVTEHPNAGNAARALRLLLDDATARGEAAGALRLCRALYPRVRDSALGDNILYAQARLLDSTGERRGARAALERLVERYPYPHGELWDDALWQLADMAEEDGDYAGAVAELSRMVAVREWTNAPGSYTLPRFPVAQLRIARLHRDRLADPSAAARAFRATYEDFPNSTVRDDALTELGEMLIEQGERREGCELLGDVVREFETGRARRRAEARVERDCR